MIPNQKTILYQVVIVLNLLGSQTRVCAQDSSILTPQAFIQQLKQFHPVAKQARIITENASATLMTARGAFDPVLELNSNNKTLDGVEYYRYLNPEVQLPTALGPKFKAGVENSTGQFKNPELTTGIASYLGVELPLMNGLLIDKKRAVLQQAKIFQQQSEQDRDVLINDLLLNAYTAYWEWTSAFQMVAIYHKYVRVAEKRKRLVGIAFKEGDRSAADTIEASAQLENYRLLQADALLKLNATTLEMSQYLWTDKGEPYQLPQRFVPDTIQFTISMPVPDTAGIHNLVKSNHPVLKAANFKLDGLEVERKLKFQNLLPVVNVQANLLSKEYFRYKDLSGYFLENNYKFGVRISVPVPLREGRGNYKSIKLKINDSNLELEKKSWEIQNKIMQYYNEALQLRQQLQAASNVLFSYRSLQNIEELKFFQGESSLFLVNTRENKTLEIEQKIIELKEKYIKAIYKIQWAAAIFQ